MLVGRQYYYIECDHDDCIARSPSDDDHVSAWIDPTTALDEAKEGDWLLVGGEHYCPDHAVFCVDCEDVIVPAHMQICDDCAEIRRETIGRIPKINNSPTTQGK